MSKPNACPQCGGSGDDGDGFAYERVCARCDGTGRLSATPPWVLDEAQVRLRFFRDLTPEQRAALYIDFGIKEGAVAQLTSHADEARLLDFFLSRFGPDGILRRINACAPTLPPHG